MGRIYVVEPGPTGGPGAMGVLLLIDALRRAGHDTLHLRLSRKGSDDAALFVYHEAHRTSAAGLPKPDAVYVSCVSVQSWLHLRQLFRRLDVPIWTRDRQPSDPLIAWGGQALLSPEPVAPFADVMALGDGEATGPALATAAERGRQYAMAWARGRRGYYVPSQQSPPELFERLEVPTLTPRSVIAKHRSPTIELARGCASKCAFCSIGWAGGTYREADRAAVASVLERHAGQPVNLFAPDFTGLSYDGGAVLESAGCSQRGRDARMDTASRVGFRPGRAYSFGVEAGSARLRAAVGKPLTDDDIVSTMARLYEVGVQAVRWYVIGGLPGETDEDRNGFLRLLRDTATAWPRALDVSLTHFQALPHTPLQWADAHHRAEVVKWYEQIKALMQELHPTREMGATGKRCSWRVTKPNHAGRHEHTMWLLRGDRGTAEYLAELRPTWVRRHTWRPHAGYDPARLDALEVGQGTPWAHVIAGDRNAADRASLAYLRRLDASSFRVVNRETPTAKGRD